VFSSWQDEEKRAPQSFSLAAQPNSFAATTCERMEHNMERKAQDEQSPLSAALISPLNKDHAPRVEYLQEEAKANRQTKVSAQLFPPSPPLHTTLLDLVRAVNEMTDDEQVVIATVAQLVNSGQARLIGTFKNARMITL
jgi:hypothetical protein